MSFPSTLQKLRPVAQEGGATLSPFHVCTEPLVAPIMILTNQDGVTGLPACLGRFGLLPRESVSDWVAPVRSQLVSIWFSL